MRSRLAAISGGVMIILATIGCTRAATTAVAGSSGVTPGSESLRVPCVSMEPTLKPGSTITVDLRAYSGKGPMIGDIVVFHPPRGADPQQPVCAAPHGGIGSNQACGVSTPKESKETFGERVVAVPGDNIKIVNGHVIRNG